AVHRPDIEIDLGQPVDKVPVVNVTGELQILAAVPYAWRRSVGQRHQGGHGFGDRVDAVVGNFVAWEGVAHERAGGIRVACGEIVDQYRLAGGISQPAEIADAHFGGRIRQVERVGQLFLILVPREQVEHFEPVRFRNDFEKVEKS